MIAKEWARSAERIVIALAAAGALASQPAWAQSRGRAARSAPAQATKAQLPAQAGGHQTSPLDQISAPRPALIEKAIPVNPTDPVALINGEPITREQLASECVARRGKEILDTLIARKLIEQAIRAKKLDVTAAEIEAEIDGVARKMSGGTLDREGWLRTLDKERGISPVQYARDIIYPMIALRKLAGPRVQVTADDMDHAFEAHYGEKLRCRMILTDKLRAAQEVWEELKKNPAAFDKVAMNDDRSKDVATRSLGGLMPEPITRYAYPRTVSDAAFAQLVDGDPQDKDPAHKPKDGDISGPIQVTESSWIILKREKVIPATKVDRKDPKIRDQIYQMMYDAKLQAVMGEVYQDLFRGAAIENILTGQTKQANEDEELAARKDGDVRLMSNPSAAIAPSGKPAAGAPGRASTQKDPRPPVGVSTEEAKRVEAIKKSLEVQKR